jgi:hypothetical protein
MVDAVKKRGESGKFSAILPRHKNADEFARPRDSITRNSNNILMEKGMSRLLKAYDWIHYFTQRGRFGD